MLKIISSQVKQAKSGDSYSYSSVQFNLPADLSKQIREWSKHNIANQYIYTEHGDRGYGREDEIHVTIKYGLLTINPDDVKSVVKNFGTCTARLSKMSRFVPNDKDYEVVKVDITSKRLHDLHKLIGAQLENEDEHSGYKPHVTIAYVKPGTCNDLSGNTDFAGRKIDINRLTFSAKDDTKHFISLA